MTRRRHRGPRPPGLLGFYAGHLVAEVEPADNPLTRACPHCHAGPGHPCTRPGRHGHRHGHRHPIPGYHHSRTNPET